MYNEDDKVSEYSLESSAEGGTDYADRRRHFYKIFKTYKAKLNGRKMQSN